MSTSHLIREESVGKLLYELFTKFQLGKLSSLDMDFRGYPKWSPSMLSVDSSGRRRRTPESCVHTADMRHSNASVHIGIVECGDWVGHM